MKKENTAGKGNFSSVLSVLSVESVVKTSPEFKRRLKNQKFLPRRTRIRRGQTKIQKPKKAFQKTHGNQNQNIQRPKNFFHCSLERGISLPSYPCSPC